MGERTRNILTLEERIKVIQAYDKKPIYQKVANIFQCSSKQIKNIICNRESILMYYGSCMSNGNSNEAKRIRHEKIVFLGKVIFEYLLRTQAYPTETPLTTQMIRNKALEIRDAIKIANFYPNTAWINNFKSEYGITDFETPIRNANNGREIPSCVDANDLILYVCNRETPNFQINLKPKPHPNGGIVNNDLNYVPELSSANHNSLDSRQNFDYNSLYNEVVSLDSDNENEGDENENPFYNHDNNMTANTYEEESSEYQIKNYNEALQYLKPLEHFALLQEDHRAIGIISQLEKIFKFTPAQDQS